MVSPTVGSLGAGSWNILPHCPKWSYPEIALPRTYKEHVATRLAK